MIDRWIFQTPSPPPDHRIKYGRSPHQFGELRLPQKSERERSPTIVVIHGGFWLAEFDIAHIGHLAARLTAQGFATWSLEFRRVGNLGGAYPGTFHDIAAGVDHLRRIADEHRLDLDDVTTLGHSAGGHLALWTAGRRRLATDDPLFSEDPLSVRRVVSLAGVADLQACWEQKLGYGVAEHFLGGSPDAEPSRYASCSPAQLVPLFARQMLFHGDADPFVPVEMSRDYSRLAGDAGDETSLTEFPDAGHFELIDPKSEEWAIIEKEIEEEILA